MLAASNSLRYRWLPLLLMASFLAIPSTSCGQGSARTIEWVRQVNQTLLDYHCRIRYGEDPSKMQFSSNLIRDKWDAVEKILTAAEQGNAASPWKEIDTQLINTFRLQREFELLLQEKEAELEDQFRYFIFRAIAEEMGGDDVRRIYEAMPDDWQIKQNLSSVAQNLVNAGITLNEFRQVLAQVEFEVRQHIRQHAGTESESVLAELDRIHDFETIAIFERDWLMTSRPGLFDRMNLEAGARLRELRNYLTPYTTPAALDDFQQFGGPLAERLLVHFSWAQHYEQLQLPWLAANELAAAKRVFWRARESTYLNKAKSLSAPELWFAKLQCLMESTMHPVTPDRFDAVEFQAVSPIDSAVYAQLIDTAGNHFGFVGGIEVAAEPLAVSLTADDRRLVLMCAKGLLTYDLTSGRREHLIFDLPNEVTLTSMATTIDGKWAYVVTSQPSVIRYDLVSGKRDPGFSEIANRRADDRVAVSHDGKTLAVGGDVNLYDANTGAHLQKLKGRFNTMKYGMTFSPDDKWLFTHGNDARVMYGGIDGTRGGERRIVPKGNVYVYTLITRLDGIQIACGPGVLTAWRGAAEEPVFQIQLPEDIADKFRWADVTPDHQFIISSLGIWNFQTGDLVVRFSPTWNLAAMALTSDGQRLIVCRGNGVFVIPMWLTKPGTGVAAATPLSAEAGGHQQKKDAEQSDAEMKEPQGTRQIPPAEMRTWRDSSGKYEIKAKLVDVVGETVVLQDESGKRIEVDLSRLSDSDREYVRGRQGGS
jgi:hypothetical protein